MDRERVIAALNRNLALEYGAVIQYLQHSYLVRGTEREVFAPFFAKQADSSLGHAKKLGEKIVALGGVPTVEPAPVQQATTLQEMLEQDLARERESVRAYTETYELVQDDVALRFLIEELIYDEQSDVEELEKLLAQREAAAARPVSRRQRAAGA
ncbi:MAG TPA: ferritin-like domain-containing protein [Chloroflexota bacterium]|jgi:bacterioferritin|nr:ferritin-like domain-containing protein [Chloroflexota bacterium]HZU07274.1 ferritin-like domain-containing protein [Chloroflexota bacterium]